MSYKITRLVRQIMEIKEGKKHNQKPPEKQKDKPQATKKHNCWVLPYLPLLSVLLRVLFETCFETLAMSRRVGITV